jgi:hypothetical protein
MQHVPVHIVDLLLLGAEEAIEYVDAAQLHAQQDAEDGRPNRQEPIAQEHLSTEIGNADLLGQVCCMLLACRGCWTPTLVASWFVTRGGLGRTSCRTSVAVLSQNWSTVRGNLLQNLAPRIVVTALLKFVDELDLC